MSFEPLKEKGIPLEKQIRYWEQIVQKPYSKADIDCYTRTRQILMNGIEIEAWGFKHLFSRLCSDIDDCKVVSNIRRIEDTQQTTINWLAPSDQTVLDTTLGYEQVAVDLTAWLAQNEPDEYVRETFNFGLLEDFDHLYRYSQWINMLEGKCPNSILQEQTDVILGRPTQHHHNENYLRIRKPYDKNEAKAQTKVNILTLLSAEQQTHNYYAEHGFSYANKVLRETYAEIKDVEEEHVTMYESLIDPTESIYEKLLLHEFTEVCNYYTCFEDEVDERIKGIWEMFLDFEIEHLKIAAELFKKYERRDPEEVIGHKIIIPCRFKSQKYHVEHTLRNEIDKRLGDECSFSYAQKTDLPSDWASYRVQEQFAKFGAPTEETIALTQHFYGRNIVFANDELKRDELKLLSKGLQETALAENTVTPEYLDMMVKEFDEAEEKKSQG